MKVTEIYALVIICSIIWIEVSGKHVRKNKRSVKIVNGDEAVPHSLPYMAAIHTVIDERAVLCGGSLITNSLVLTAAKCLDGATEAEVILGAHNLDEAEETQIQLVSSEFIIYDNYDKETLLHNIALIHLPSVVTFNGNIGTVEIQLDDASPNYEEQLALVAGWGKMKDTAPGTSSVLREIEVTVIPNVMCDIPYLFSIQSNQICTTGTEQENICLGDAGSPLVINGIQVGIASFGSDYGCEVGLPGVYTRLSKYIKWLSSNIDAYSES